MCYQVKDFIEADVEAAITQHTSTGEIEVDAIHKNNIQIERTVDWARRRQDLARRLQAALLDMCSRKADSVDAKGQLKRGLDIRLSEALALYESKTVHIQMNAATLGHRLRTHIDAVSATFDHVASAR